MVFDSVYEMTNYLKSPIITPTVNVNDDLTSDKGWQSNTSDWTYNATGDYIDFATIRRSTTAQQIYIDMQDSDYLGSGNNLSDSKWVARFKIRTGAVASGGNIMFYLGFSNNLADSGTTQQSATMKLNFSPTENNMALSVSRGNFETSSSPVRENANVYTNTNLPFSTDFYMEMIRDGDTFTLKAYSNEYVTQVGATATVTVTGISALRYIKAFNDSEQNHSGTSTGNRLYDMKIYNGESTTSSYPKPRGQHFWEYFSGGSLNSRWTERNGLSGDGTVSTSYAVMADEVNGGVKISSNTGTWGKTTLSFNGKRQFDATASVMTFIGRRTGHSVGYNITGLSDHLLIWDNAPQEVGIKNYSEDSSFKVITSDGTQQSETDFNPTVAIDTNFHNFQIVNTSTSNSGYIDGVLGLSKTTNRPTGKLQPQMLAMTKASEQASAINQIYYIEVYNT